MSFFTSEKAMQIWLEDKLEIVDGLAEIIDNVQEIEDYIPKNISEVKIKKTIYIVSNHFTCMNH